MTVVLIRDGREDMDTQERSHVKMEVETERSECFSHKPRNGWSHQKLGEGREHPPPPTP